MDDYLAPIPHLNTESFSEESSSDDDSCVEITSNIDENEKELIKWSNYLQIDSNDDDDSDENYSSDQPTQLVNYSTSGSSYDEENAVYAPSLNGKKRMRLHGGGKKLTYVDLDVRLLAWYREKRTAPGSTTAAAHIHKERVTFRQLQRRGQQINIELNHQCPSAKWFGRFPVRHRLSLQRPKRQQKIPLNEIHQKATSFYTFLRRASRWALKRGQMGAFTFRDIFNMDESPLALFGDQSKRSINDINTCNEVEGCLSNKRFCTVILTVSGEDQRVDPILLFKGKGHVSAIEQQQYADGIKVCFIPEGVINTVTMNKYNEWFVSKVQDGHPKMLIVDSAGSHLNPETIRSLRKKSVVVAVIPTGCTMYLQALDVSIFSIFKNHYTDAADEFIERNGPRSKLKLTASHSRILCTQEFTNIGYIWKDNTPVMPRTLPNYTFDPDKVNSQLTSIDQTDNDDEERQIEIQAKLANEHDKTLLNQQNKQLKLNHFWKM
ncbi:unnamed protein product [Adineta ricciae]|uniref:DDE-1 domain-containing protein n=1 Tax=Adineta ricciae TaxID=249248 RepID=A0A814PRX2_ADIRI|nr:unnamed protein product [Adineta ricciae]CAF1109683.1 unnamed protein product [Adineta ricciae]